MNLNEKRRLKLDAALEAGNRWLERAAVRKDRIERVEKFGAGAADSPQRNQRYQARQAGLSQLREMSKAGDLPVWLERLGRLWISTRLPPAMRLVRLVVLSQELSP